MWIGPSDWVGLVKHIGKISEHISYRYYSVSESSLTKDFNMAAINWFTIINNEYVNLILPDSYFEISPHWDTFWSKKTQDQFVCQ